MRSHILSASLASLCCAMPAATLAAQPVVKFSGEIESSHSHFPAPDGRLASALLAARPSSRAFPPATVFTREAARKEQIRLKAGIEHDLDQLMIHGEPTIASLAGRLRRWIARMPVTGRKGIVTDARLMELQPQHNPRIEAGDTITYLARPSTVEVVGAVVKPCTIEHSPLDDATDYVKKCPSTGEADPDQIVVIQIDGTIQIQGVALWNRSDPQHVSPGSRILVPIATREIAQIAPDLNEDLSRFIATQLPSP